MDPCSFLSNEEEHRIKAWFLNNVTLGFPLREEDVKDYVQKLISEWREYYANNEKEKLRKEEKLT